MITYFALLRGINVGGNNKISMPELKKAFELLGYFHVSTYINSGNVVFSTNISNRDSLIKECEKMITEVFGLTISVAIIPASELKEAIDHSPEWWNQDQDYKHNLIFVIPPATSEQIKASIGNAAPEHENISFYKQFIFWSASKNNFSKTRWAKIVKHSSYQNVTIRNANTVLKLLSMVNS